MLRKGMFKVIITTPDKVIFEDECWSVFLPGETGEFEILAFHKAIVSLLRRGHIVVDLEKRIPVVKGVVKFSDEELVAVIEQ